MGIFSKLFNSMPDLKSPKNWPDFIHALAYGLGWYRGQWFSSCITFLQEQSADHDIRIVETQMYGIADLATKAYQLHLVSQFLNGQDYIPSSKITEFMAMLNAQVCGSELDECKKYLKRYAEADTGGSMHVSRFTSDVAKHITADDSPLYESVVISLQVPDFIANTRIIVAHMFRDQKTVKTLKDNLKKFYENGIKDKDENA
jgi:hypothetical protein